MKIVQPSVTLLACTPDPERLIERAGRVCWKSEDRVTDDSHVGFIRILKGKNHSSVLEHASASFKIVTDRGISHEIVRHRIGCSYSQESSRYCCYGSGKFGNEITVVCPSNISLDANHLAFNEWEKGVMDAEAAYLGMLERGAKPQDARSVLPTCLKTEIVMTANFRAWLHFLELRLSPAAHPDMRVIARMLRDELVKIAPTVFADFVEDSNGE